MSADPGRLLGDLYRVDGLLGRGGMSEVYQGYDERLGRPVAIKMLRQPSIGSGVSSTELLELQEAQASNRQRFLREVRMAAQLEHPGTPAVYDTGLTDDGRIWLVMQLLRGSTLESVLDRTTYDVDARPTIAWATAIAAQIAAVLTDLHRVDVVHRDIKPANVMIVENGLVKVLDFGIAILRGASALPRLTQVDRTVGTPVYMSPEQHLGRVVTAASDVYSLGCLLYELLVGDPPYLDSSGTPVRAHHLQSPVPSAAKARDDLPEDLDGLLSRMLDKEAEARPTAEQVYAGLAPLVGGVSAGGDDVQDPTRPFRVPLLAPRPRPAEPGHGDPLTDEEFVRIQNGAAALMADDQQNLAVETLEDGLTRAAAEPYFTLELGFQLGMIQFLRGEYRAAAAHLTMAEETYRARLGDDHPRTVQCAFYAGHAYAELGEPLKALAQLRFYLQHVDSTEPDNAEPLLESRFVIAQMLASDSRPEEARAELEGLRSEFRHHYGSGSTHVKNLERQIEKFAEG
ncbi:protein kinase domain-containing protein [Pseudonocardia pini]|uniref:protein kinase domain-containing protein n=1 Tax=Pseudonocardia pini TaxID=2758030 RepID=UPI0015F018E7|nr:serine/threonine-protein kinase [Pseudonocardia pini]